MSARVAALEALRAAELALAAARAALDAQDAPDELVIEALADRGPARLLTSEDACRLIQCSGPTLRKLRGEGLPCIMIGDSPRFEREALIAFLRARGSR